ncbi:MAG TPA: ABC transporter permease [Bacillota bacterium]|nr:ABC transporter permease [Bacillota bacterium]
MLKRLKELGRYPSAVIGSIILIVFVLFSVHTVLTFPYQEAIRLWKGGPGVWDDLPRRAKPVWYDWFTKDKLARTIKVPLEDAHMTVVPLGDGRNRVEVVFPFEFTYDTFPKEISLFTEMAEKVTIAAYMRRPHGDTITLTEGKDLRANDIYRISQDQDLRYRLNETLPHIGLFGERMGRNPGKPVKGQYEVVMVGEMDATNELRSAELVVYGQVHGWAGTDHLRRDLTVALRWGAPIGLMFGVLAAVGSTITTFILAGIGAWFGGKVDAIFHRLTEVNMILPLLVVLIMVGHFFSRSIWVILGAVILLSIFGSGMKTYRAMFLQAKEAPYIEAAQAYGAGNFRIIFRYLLPRLVPVLLPSFVTIIPSFVFLEATLAVLGLGDPVLPTWGKIIHSAQANEALYMGDYYWVLIPSVILILIGFSFALVGFTLDRIFNPRLRRL